MRSDQSTNATPVHQQVWRVIVADDHPYIRHWLTIVLERQPDFAVLDVVSGEAAAIGAVQRSVPDVLVCGVNMMELPALRLLRTLPAQTKAVVVFANDNLHHIPVVIEAGVTGCVVQSEDEAILVDAVRTVARGAAYSSPLYIRHFPRFAAVRALNSEIVLTNREQAIIDLLAQGRSDAEIGTILCIATRTVRYHTENLRQKLGLKNRACLVAWAARRSSVRIPRMGDR